MNALEKILYESSTESSLRVEHMMDVSATISKILEKAGKTPKDLAKELGHKTMHKMNRYLSGQHNFTLVEISLIEAKLECKIVETWKVLKKLNKNCKKHKNPCTCPIQKNPNKTK